jgi:hypothetical protein
MKRLIYAVLLAMACVHAKETQGQDQKNQQAMHGAKNVPQGRRAAPAPMQRPPPGNTNGGPRAFQGRPELSPTPAGLMMDGAPERIQQALIRRGYLKGKATGQLDQDTTAALRKFQADEKIARTGVPDTETLNKLGISPRDIYKGAP